MLSEAKDRFIMQAIRKEFDSLSPEHYLQLLRMIELVALARDMKLFTFADELESDMKVVSREEFEETN